MIKRSVVLHGHATSVALEAIYWEELAHWAAAEGISVPALIAQVDRGRSEGSLASALRVAVLKHAIAARAAAPVRQASNNAAPG